MSHLDQNRVSIVRYSLKKKQSNLSILCILLNCGKMECWYDFGESDVRLLSSILSISGWILTELTEKRCFDGDRS